MRGLIMLFLPSFAMAGGQVTKVETGDTIVGETIVGNTTVGGNSTRAYAFSHGLGDVDIADCLASKQFGTILFSSQNVMLNKWCAAEIYDAKGLYEMAAMMRCDIKEVAKHFATPEQCIKANTVTIPAPPPVHNDCRDDCEDSLEQVVSLAERVDALEKKRQQDYERTRRIEVRSRESGITDEQRQALAEVFEK